MDPYQPADELSGDLTDGFTDRLTGELTGDLTGQLSGTDTVVVAGPTQRPASARTVVFGLFLIGLGGASALAAQTGLSIAQAGSLMLFTCAAILFSFLVDRARNRR